jgi:hypothetical protein
MRSEHIAPPSRSRIGPGRVILLVALLVGIAVRVGWAILRRTPWATGEAPNVAMALAQGHGFSDAFMAGQGPTAHLLPIAPALAGAVYWLFGIRTVAAEAVLCAWSIGVSFASYVLLYAIFKRLGTPRWARIGALAFLLVAPIYTTNEAFEWRVWEGGLGLLLGNLTLYTLLRADTDQPPRGFALWQALLPALTFFVNPVIGLAAYAAWALYLWRNRRTVPAIARATAATLLALALLIGPWTARNWLVMGHPIALRDDLGMELAVANYPEAVDGDDRNKVFYDRLTAIQPYIHPIAQRAMIEAGGEVAYSQKLGRDTKAWIAANPSDFLLLCRRHLGQMTLPGTWMFMTSHGVWLPVVRSWLARTVNILGFLGLAFALARRSPRYLYVLPFVMGPTLLYIPFQPVIRYCWLIYPAMACLAGDFVARVALRVSRRRRHQEMVSRLHPHSQREPAPAP